MTSPGGGNFWLTSLPESLQRTFRIHQVSAFATLPSELVALISSFLCLADQIRCSETCTLWKYIIRSSLAYIDLSDIKVNDSVLINLSHYSRLTDLNLAKKTITNKGLKHLTSFQSLRFLNLSWCSKVTNKSLEYVAKLTNLRTLKLRHCNQVSKRGVEFLSSLVKLERLKLPGYIPDSAIKQLAGFISLRSLDLHESAITAKGLKFISSLTNLTELNLSHCGQATREEGISYIALLTNLQLLKLEEHAINSNYCLAYLARLTNLTYLNLSAVDNSDEISDVITVDGLYALESLTNLTWLDLAGWHSVDDAVLTKFTCLTNLEFLNLQWCNVTRGGLDSINKMVLLKVLDVRNTSVKRTDCLGKLTALQNLKTVEF